NVAGRFTQSIRVRLRQPRVVLRSRWSGEGACFESRGPGIDRSVPRAVLGSSMVIGSGSRPRISRLYGPLHHGRRLYRCAVWMVRAGLAGDTEEVPARRYSETPQQARTVTLDHAT